MGMEGPHSGEQALRLFRSLYDTLDQDVEACFRYVEPTERNIVGGTNPVEVYSVELYRLHMDICAAIDSLLHFWHLTTRGKGSTTMNDYLPLLQEPELDVNALRELTLRRNPEIKICPLASWSENATPQWWTEHNKTKHRLQPSTFNKGNLSNVVNSLGAFYLLVNDKSTRTTQPVASRVFVNLFYVL